MHEHSIEIERGTERNFGVVFAIVFAALGVYLSWRSSSIPIWPFAVSAAFLLVALLFPSVLYYPNLLWHRFGLLLGRIIAPLVMALVYIVTVVPIGLGMRLMGKDILRLKSDDEAESYWINRTSPPQPMKNQF